MTLIEIIVIISVLLFLTFVIGRTIYLKKTNKTNNKCDGNCCGCQGCSKTTNSLIEQYRKKYPKRS